MYLDTQVSRKKAGSTIVNQKSLLMIITFHSLEEKLVSQAFTIWKKKKLGDFASKKPHEPT